jgi:hypothetical protein
VFCLSAIATAVVALAADEIKMAAVVELEADDEKNKLMCE